MTGGAPTAADLKRWVENYRAAARREREEVRSRGPSPDSIRAALDLVALAGELHGWPLPEDPVSRREDELAWERWSRLRKALAHR